MRHAPRSRGSAFTLIELLVVVAIIALLISILLPSLGQARRQARAQICKSNLRSLSQAALTYCTEYGVYPPSVTNYARSSNPTTKALATRAGKDWLGVGDMDIQSGYQPGDPANPDSGNPRGFVAAPTLGLLFKTIRNEKVYLCPDDKPGPWIKDTISGGGGNGKFSYTMFAQLGMRAPEKVIPRYADKTSAPSRGSSPIVQRLKPPPLSQVPLFVEEHPDGLNALGAGGAINGQAHMEGNFNYDTDYVAARHPGGTNRKGIRPGDTSGAIVSFYQDTTHIAYADAHVDTLKTNFGFKLGNVQPGPGNPNVQEGIPYTAAGLLWYHGLEYREQDPDTQEYYVVQAN